MNETPGQSFGHLSQAVLESVGASIADAVPKAADEPTASDSMPTVSESSAVNETFDAKVVTDMEAHEECDNESKVSTKRRLESNCENTDTSDRTNDGDVPDVKKAKCDPIDSVCGSLCDYLEREHKRIQELFLEHILELFFLENGGNLIDFQSFRKKAPNNTLMQYLKENAVDSDDELKELMDVKLAVDHNACKLSEPLCEQVLQSTAIQTPPTDTSTIANTICSQTAPNTSSIVISTASKVMTTTTVSTSSARTNTSVSATPNRHTTRQHSISSIYDSAIGSQEQIVERAKQEAYVMQRIAELRKNGLWSSRRLPKVQEPARCKVHWDYLLEEMTWLAADFAQERKWKKAAAKKCSRMVIKFHHDKKCFAERAEREELLRLRKIASNIAKQVKQFWADIEKVFEAKQEVKLKEKRKKLHDMHLNFIVDKADKYTEKLTQKLGKPVISGDDSGLGSHSQNEEAGDSEFEPENSESDDEETIAKEEEEVGVGDSKTEIEMLKKESEMPIEHLKASLPKQVLDCPQHEDTDFKVDDQSIAEEDDEETIQEQEDNEGKVDYSSEIKDLENDANIPIEVLLEKYATSDNFLDSDDDCDDEYNSEEYDYSIENNDDSTEEEEEMSTEEESEDIGMEFLINPETKLRDKPLIEEICDESSNAIKSTKTSVGPNKEITDIAAGAESLQPKGNTLSTVHVCTKVPFLLKHELREYQHIGLDWLVAMQDKKLNGILADEMGLGKTIQTIALLAHLACDKGIWGPHLIVVPTSVMLNWEMEFKKWCPAFKILTYYGSPKERKLKRQGWTKPNQFHVCITSYKLVIQDHQSFRRKKWKYFILDEAQHIKNFKSQRWQMLLNFNTSRRLLLTGTPLQNNLMELWSLMHFLMPNVFQSHKEFRDWFVNPVTGMLEGSHEVNENLIRRLHKVLRPFLLRRLKCDVEKQLPKKYEHVVMCRLSKRQRYLYEEFMSLGKTKETLASGNFLSVINILMQLRKVCNHPNLFDPRPTISPFMIEPLTYYTASLVTTALDYDPSKHVNLKTLNLQLSDLSFTLSAFAHHRIVRFMASPDLIQEIDSVPEPAPRCPSGKIRLQIRTSTMHSTSPSKPVITTPTTLLPTGNRVNEQRLLIAHNPSLQSSPTKLSPASSSTPDGNRVAIPLSRLVQTPAGQHILLRTSSGTPISSTLSPTTTILRQNQSPQSPMRQIILTRTVQPVGLANSQDQYVTCAQLPTSSKLVSSPFIKTSLIAKQQLERKEKLKFLSRINTQRCNATALYASDLIEVATINNSPKFLLHTEPLHSSIFNIGNGYLNCLLCTQSDNYAKHFWCFTHSLSDMVKTPERIAKQLDDMLSRYVCIVPRVVAPPIQLHASHYPPSKKSNIENLVSQLNSQLSDKCHVLKTVLSNMRTQFPELRLIQYDCGKLQTLDKLLWELKTGGHRVLMFTQMSRMLDIFEQFLNYHGHTYLRLDGTTKIEQRQALMERFNADKRIFCFILSTRSGGIGVNLTGADTVIFYDSDWNPTMDAQAQDRCHRIGQTRDVHIYRLISEMSVEENILKKAQQKRLLGDVAIEGGNFTTAFFKRNAIQELFGIELKNELRMLATHDLSNTDNSEQMADVQLEQALCTAEEDNDIAAAKTARAEAAAEFAEFDENIPIDNDAQTEEKSAEEEKIDELIEQLKPIEKYAMHLLETFQESSSFEQLKQAEEEIEAHKKEWELGRLQTEREANERLKASNEEQKEPMLTCHRDDAYNQVYLSYNGLEQMPIWAPPTPPQDDNDLYIDFAMGFMYEHSLMPESQLPPVYVPKETNKRLRLDTTVARKQKVRKEEGFNIPRSLFDRPSTAIIKLRRELILQKLRGTHSAGSESAAIHRTLTALGTSYALPQSSLLPSQTVAKSPQTLQSSPQTESIPVWGIHEDWAVLQVIQYFQDLPLNLLILSPGHVPNWDLVCDVVNSISSNYRSPKLCKYHYESALVPREEGKVMFEAIQKQKQKKVKGVTCSQTLPPNVNVTAVNPKPNTGTRPMRTSQLFVQDSNTTFSQLSNQRFELIKQIANKRTPTLKPMFINPTGKNPKHIALLSENNINYDMPLTPIQVAINRAERISREKQKVATEQQIAARQQQMQIQVKQQQHQPQPQMPQIKAILTPNTIPAAHHQLQQAISAKVAALNQATLSKVVTTTGMASNSSSVTTSTQLNLTKALTQVSSISNPVQHSLPQPILSQINVNPAIASTSSSPEGVSPAIQLSQQTCSVVSVAALTPQVHQKLIAAVSPVGQMTNQQINRFNTAQTQVYKQLLLRQQQQQQLQRHQSIATSPHIQIQQLSQQTGKQITALGIGQQQPRFQITATVTQQPIQHTQSLIATTALRASPPNMTSLPVAVPVAGSQQQRILTTTTACKPNPQIITRTITDPLQMAQIIKRQQQSTTNLPQTQILLQQPSGHQSQSTQAQQLLQNPVTFVKSLTSPATLATQSLTIPVTGMSIFTSSATKAGSPSTSVSTTSAPLTPVSATQLRQIQLLQQKRAQQQPQVVQQQQQQQQQQIQAHVAQQIGQPVQQKISATIATQAKGIKQLQTSPVGTIQILHQPSQTCAPNVTTTKSMQTVTVQQLQQVLKQGFSHSLPHTIHVSQSPVTSSATLIPQSILQAVTQAKSSQVVNSQLANSSQSTAPIAVTQIASPNPSAQSVKHIQVVTSPSAGSQAQTVASVVPKSIIISGQPTILQTTSLQHAVQSQPQTVTFAIRPLSASTPATQQTALQSQQSMPAISASADVLLSPVVPQELELKEEAIDGSNQSQAQTTQTTPTQVRQSPYATRQRNNKNN